MAVKKPKTTEQKIVRIIETMINRSRKDINDWRKALKTAENVYMPRRRLLIDLYHDLVFDLHIIMLMNRTRRHLTSHPLQVVGPDRKPDAEKTKLLEKKWMRQMLRHYADTRFYGHSLMQITKLVGGEIAEIELVNRAHVVPEAGGWMVNSFDSKIIPYRDDPAAMKWLIEAGEPKDFGWLNACAPMILFKKNAMVAWSEFCEIFGLPIRYVTTNSRQKSELDRLEASMQSMGKAAYGIFQEGEEIKFADIVRSDAFNVFDKLADRANSEMSKAILGETMTADVGANGSRAQAEVHQGVSDEAAQSNREDCIVWLNESVKPVLNAHGYGLENYEIQYAQEKVVSKEAFEIDMGLHDRFEIPVEYFAEKYGVPIEKVKERQQQQNSFAQQQEEALKMKGILKLHAKINKLYHHQH